MAIRDYDIEVPDFDRHPEYGINMDYKAEMAWESEYLQKADEAYERTGDLKGYVLRFSMYDGYALYQVTSLRPLKLAHIRTGDGYQIPDAHLRGVNLEDVKNMVAWDMKWKKAGGFNR